MASTSDLKDPDHLEASSNTTNEEVNSSSQTFIIQESPKPQILQDQLQSTATQASSPTKLFVEEAKPIKHSDPREPMAPFEWDSLEKRYLKTMEECEQEERKIYQEFHDWVKVGIISFARIYIPLTYLLRFLRLGLPSPAYMRMTELTKGM